MEHAQQELLRRLTLSDEHVSRQLMREQAVERPLLNERTRALVRLASLVATDADIASFQMAVDAALAAGADDLEIIDVLLAVGPIVGLSRVNAAARALGTALGHERDLGGR